MWPTDWQSNKIARMRSSNLLSQETERRTELTFPEPMCTQTSVKSFIGTFSADYHTFHFKHCPTSLACLFIIWPRTTWRCRGGPPPCRSRTPARGPPPGWRERAARSASAGWRHHLGGAMRSYSCHAAAFLPMHQIMICAESHWLSVVSVDGKKTIPLESPPLCCFNSIPCHVDTR